MCSPMREPAGTGAMRWSGYFGNPCLGVSPVNDAERLRHDPAMRWIVGGKTAQGCAASPSQMGRFETKWLAVSNNLSALADLSGRRWIDGVHGRRPPRGIVLDMDSSVSPTHGIVTVTRAVSLAGGRRQ
jgi:Transposase DDE domain group 1